MVFHISYLPEHAKAGKFVSFHKLSQWLTYSLMEPLQDAGFKITDLKLMTGRIGNNLLCLDVVDSRY